MFGVHYNWLTKYSADCQWADLTHNHFVYILLTNIFEYTVELELAATCHRQPPSVNDYFEFLLMNFK